MKNVQDQVALFIDFENLMYGLTDRFGDQGAFERFQAGRLMSFARDFGVLRWAKAYADWRMRAMNRFQQDLFSHGVELNHVLSRGQKNAVDVKMAVDMIESIFLYPDVNVYILCSGDRDFLPVLNTLIRHGKRVLILSPQKALSTESKRVGAETYIFESLSPASTELLTVTGPSARAIEQLRDHLVSILNAHPRGLSGALLKLALIDRYGGRFDERSFGFVKLGELLNAFSELLEVERPSEGDLHVRLRKPNQSVTVEDRTAEIFEEALTALKGYQYQISPSERRTPIKLIYQMINRPEGLRWSDHLDYLCLQAKLSKSQANKYHAILLQSQLFKTLPSEQDLPVKQRQLTLNESIKDVDDLIERFEISILFKVANRLDELPEDVARQLLGLDDNEQERSYVKKLLNAVETLRNRDDNS